MELFSAQFWVALGSIIVLDLVLAGDNAVVIAMAARRLPQELQKRAIMIGTAGAIVIRALMTIVATWLLQIPFLQALGGVILLPIAVKLLKPHTHVKSMTLYSSSMRSAIQTIIIADVAMGVDNVLAIAGAAHGDFLLVIIGLLISIPLIVSGSRIIASLMDKYPILIAVGSAILGYTAGSMIMHDGSIGAWLLAQSAWTAYLVPLATTILVLVVPHYLYKRV